jgi:hypothetical protein
VIKKEHRFLNLAKINRSTEKYNSLLKKALTLIIGLLYLQLTDHANVPWAVDIIIFMQGFPETLKLFQGFLQGKKIEKGCSRLWHWANKLYAASAALFPDQSSAPYVRVSQWTQAWRSFAWPGHHRP